MSKKSRRPAPNGRPDWPTRQMRKRSGASLQSRSRASQRKVTHMGRPEEDAFNSRQKSASIARTR
ncbi:hypothetical protein T4E_3126 [Trichinella pseudospiralis]|uniref:Uncharacterized protein n=1 Tax=Trichinella pseudospiralis TaxID=6337 RepID=A0A0V0XUI3_TRIPS|nr:hypothetical protein T4E_3126 [Trichinella pseudospiralis]